MQTHRVTNTQATYVVERKELLEKLGITLPDDAIMDDVGLEVRRFTIGNTDPYLEISIVTAKEA